MSAACKKQAGKLPFAAYGGGYGAQHATESWSTFLIGNGANTDPEQRERNRAAAAKRERTHRIKAARAEYMRAVVQGRPRDLAADRLRRRVALIQGKRHG